MPGLAGRRALVKVSGDPVNTVDEATTNTGDNKTYQVTNAARRVFHPTGTVVVEINGTPMAPNGADPWAVNRLTGKIIFVTPNAGRGTVTVTVDYLPMSVAAGARAYSFEVVSGVVDDTDFDSANTNGGFPTKLAGMLDVRGSVGKRWRTDFYFRDKLLSGAVVTIEFYPLRTQSYDLIAWAVLERQSLQAAVEGTVDVDTMFQGAPDIDGRVISLP